MQILTDSVDDKIYYNNLKQQQELNQHLQKYNTQQ